MNRSAPSYLLPLTLEQFYADYWEKQPLHISRSDSSLSSLVDFASIEALLANQPLYFPGIQLTRSGHDIELASYADEQNRILPLRLIEYYEDGATIVLSQAQTLFSTLNALCRETMRTLKMRCQTNVYISPPGNQGFNAHYDTHDVFIIQVSGSKTFNFYPSSVELPFPDERFDASKVTLAEIDESIALSAGDTLYIPRGVVHDAVADEQAPSIHVTLGVYPVVMRDILQEAVQIASQSTPALRKSVNTLGLDSVLLMSDTPEKALGVMIKDVMAVLQSPDTLQQVLARFDDELSLSALQNCDGLTLRRHGFADGDIGLQDCSTIKLRSEMVIDYECGSAGVKIHSFGQIVEFAAPISKTVSQLLSQGQLNMNDIDELSDDQRTAMIDRLLRENLIEIR